MLVWRRRHASLSFQRAVTPTEAYLRGPPTRPTPHPHVHNACTHASLSPSLFHSPPPFHLSLRRRPRKREGAPTHDRVSSTLSAPTLHPSTQFPLTLIYLNYILRASAGGRVCVPVPTRAATRHGPCVRAADSYACEGASVWTR